MMARRWGVFVHDADGDSGYGGIVGPFQTAAAADRKADAIRKVGDRRGSAIECIVVPVFSGATAAKAVNDYIEEGE